jgi:hypothetical protein
VTILGLPAGVTEFDAVDAAALPAELVAVVVKVYEAPSVKPVITQDVDGASTLQEAPFEAVIKNESARPPLVLGLTVTVALPLPATAVGADGTPGGSKVHFAISVTLSVVEFVNFKDGFVKPPPVHPANPYPGRLNVPAERRSTSTPCAATVGAAVPVPPLMS